MNEMLQGSVIKIFRDLIMGILPMREVTKISTLDSVKEINCKYMEH